MPVVRRENGWWPGGGFYPPGSDVVEAAADRAASESMQDQGGGPGPAMQRTGLVQQPGRNDMVWAKFVGERRASLMNWSAQLDGDSRPGEINPDPDWWPGQEASMRERVLKLLSS